jgi:hypothetical protein
MCRSIAAYPLGRKLHVILDNLNTHKKNKGWLAQERPKRPFPFHAYAIVVAQSNRDLVFHPLL